ncbi:GNAT family N-acetyltransferase [Streptomyces tubbatahanensis]|uniref:GNAT family N-acetyltransferase n=1 Tax=Streptomyces tubbatahanensis TaxID=2923272 RepID=A0ABY3XP85_9ACTN|nr:GNAT family N-acetyltransferase [Streptomyces tubbatahanensis]UNS96220.1 GNAT family N-acetyltransferase [Streptomyces tubbatahanensis]
MTLTIRALRAEVPADAEAFARTRRATIPYLVCTAEALAWEAAHAPASQRLRRLLATRPDGTVAGCADTGLLAGSTAPGHGFLHTAVPPGQAGRGAGTALVAAGEAYLAGLGVRRVHSWVADEDGARRFAERLGYRRSRQARFLGLDLRRTPLPELPAPLPAGVALASAADFADDLRPLYEADVECAADEPGDVDVGATPYEVWLRLNWGRPDWDAGLSGVVLVDGRVAAYSVAQIDGVDRYWSGMTGTRRAYRGRGLAALAKLAALRRARAAGYAHAYTGNDATNTPMLAVNRRLGYRVVASEWRHLKTL